MIIDKDYFQKILGEKFIIEKLLEDDEYIYVFFVPKIYITSLEHEIFYPIGLGPFVFNKKTQTYTHDRYVDFDTNHGHKEIIKKYYEQTKANKELSYEELLTLITKRKHINFCEIGDFMKMKGIDDDDVQISGSIPKGTVIEFYNNTNMDLFINFFNQAKLDFKVEGDRIILKPLYKVQDLHTLLNNSDVY